MPRVRIYLEALQLQLFLIAGSLLIGQRHLCSRILSLGLFSALQALYPLQGQLAKVGNPILGKGEMVVGAHQESKHKRLFLLQRMQS